MRSRRESSSRGIVYFDLYSLLFRSRVAATDQLHVHRVQSGESQFKPLSNAIKKTSLNRVEFTEACVGSKQLAFPVLLTAATRVLRRIPAPSGRESNLVYSAGEDVWPPAAAVHTHRAPPPRFI